LCQEERYLAAIPLIFIVADGVGQDYFGKAIFSEGTDLTELNAISGHAAGLALLTSELSRTRQKFNQEEMNFPYRNGILHGRDVNYGNRLVAAKAWAYLSCIGDVIRAREAAKAAVPESQSTLRQSLEKYQDTLAHKKMIDDWEPRPVSEPKWLLSTDKKSGFGNETPEALLVEFLTAWHKKNYGAMGKTTVYYDNRPINKRAGQIRNEMRQLTLIDALILSVEDYSPAITNINCQLTIKIDEHIQKKLFTFKMIYGDENSNPLSRGHEDGTWKVVPSYQGWAIGFWNR
jgi:hypothetical protein